MRSSVNIFEPIE